MSMLRFAPCLALLVACVTQEDPPYGAPGAIANQKFPGEAPTSSGSTSSGGDGGSSGTTGGPFPAAYNETTPAAPTEATGPMHPTVANGVAITPTTACLSCHGQGQSGSQKKWAFAGWAASAPASTTGLDKGEVIVIDGAKTIGPVKTAPDGYFWIDATAGTLGPNAKTAIRDKTGKTSAMTQAASGDCGSSSCHGGGAGPIDFRP